MHFLVPLFLVALCLPTLCQLAAQDVQISGPPRQWQNLHSPCDTWGTVTFEAQNPHAEAKECFITSHFEDQPQQQFGRRCWLPPRSVLKGWYLVKTPPEDENSSMQEGRVLNSMLIRKVGAIESSSVMDSRERRDGNYIRVRKDAARTLLIRGNRDEESHQFVAAARSTQTDPKNFLILPRPVLPPEAGGYEQWTHIVLATDRILEDQAGLEALRQWIVRGGNLWILLDKTGPEVLPPLLADAGGLSVVDRVGLTSLEFVGAVGDFQTSGKMREFETPVDMVRVVSQGLDVLCQVSGWDAALRARVGKGKVLVTTLESRAWLQPREEALSRRWPAELDEAAYPLEECLRLGEAFWSSASSEPPVEMAKTATRYVGYRTTSLTWVASILGTFCGSTLILALVLWRTERLTWLAWSAPLLALIATLALGVSGYRMRTAIPPTEASIQIAEADSLGQVHIQGGFSVNSVTNGDTGPYITGGGRLDFVHPPAGIAKRLVWTDFGKSHWENLDLNTGIHEFRCETHDTQIPRHAIVSWNDQGAIGRLSNSDRELPQRGLIVTPSGQLASPRFLENGRFESTANDRLTPGQFSANDVIDDREQARIDVLRQMFGENQRWPRRPRLYFWTQVLDTGMRTQTEGQQVGDALLGLPIVFERPAAGTAVFCPDYFIGFRSIAFPHRGASMTFNNRSRVWSELLLRRSATTLEFQLPPELGRFRLDQLRLFVDINAPDRPFQLLALDQKDPEWKKELAERKSPVGLFEFDLAGESLPPLDENLSFTLGMDVGPQFEDPLEMEEADPARHAWQFRNLWIEAWGTVLE